MAETPREENQMACVVFTLMACSLLEPQGVSGEVEESCQVTIQDWS